MRFFPHSHNIDVIDLTHPSVIAFARHLSVDRKRSFLIVYKSPNEKQTKHASFKFNLFHRFLLLLLHNLNKLTQMFACICFEKDVGVFFLCLWFLPLFLYFLFCYSFNVKYWFVLTLNSVLYKKVLCSYSFFCMFFLFTSFVCSLDYTFHWFFFLLFLESYNFFYWLQFASI